MLEHNLNQLDDENIYELEQSGNEIVVAPYGALTTTDEIRAVFGLSDAELPDEMLTQRMYAREVETSLLEISPNLATHYAEYIELNPVIRSLVESFALYCVANMLCDMLPMLAARSMSDSKAMFQRFQTDFQSAILAIRQRFALAKEALTNAVNQSSNNQIRRPVLFGSGKPVVDRVTNSGAS